MQINYINKNGEKLAFFTFHDPSNRNSDVLEHHQKVTKFFNIPWNYVFIDYKNVNHGSAIEWTIKTFGNQIDYFAFIDNDCIPLVKNIDQIIYEKLKDKNTLFGGVQNTNHIHKEQHHPFIAPSSFCISSELYRKIGQPHLGDSISRSDHTEEATFKCQELGFQVCMVYPVDFNKLTTDEIKDTNNPESWTLQSGNNFNLRYGLGTNYGNLFYHASMQNIPRSQELFKQKCLDIINQSPKLNGITTCVDYSDFLEETIVYNKLHFDRYIVVTSPQDTKTQELCKKESVELYITDAFHRNNQPFNKGLALSEALKDSKLSGWIIVHDCDTCLPFNFKDLIDFKSMDIQKIYGGSRKFIPTYREWRECLDDPSKFNQYKSIIGTACGFCQIFNTESNAYKQNINNNIYGSFPTANFCDIHFLYHWCPPPHPKPEHLNFDCYHLTEFHGTAHAGRFNSTNQEFKKEFKDINAKT
jgi:hypothetical protein